MEMTLENNGTLRKQMFKSVNKAIVSSFYFTHELRQALAHHLRANGWNVCECNSETDACIGASCRQDDIVITRDCDLLIYSNINTIWRPSSHGQYLVYSVPQLLLQLQLSRVGLTTLGVVTQNDYGKGIHKMGINSNYDVILDLENQVSTYASVEEQVRAYLGHPTVSSKHSTKGLFDSAIRIFTTQQYTTATLPHIQGPINELREMTQRLANIRLHLKISQQISRSVPGSKQEQTTSFIRYSTIDRPPSQKPPPHASGRQYKYRERYAIKTRSRLISHKKPDIFKQHVWKPPKENTESTNNPCSTTSTSTNVSATNPPPKKKQKSTPKKDQPAVDDMTKIQLVRAMQSEHPLRTLDIGTLNANTSRALKKEVPYDENLQDKLQHAVTTCLSDVSNLASKSKRACQQVVGQYLESLSVNHLDEDDKIILNYLTPHFSVQEIAMARKGTTPGPEDESSDDEDDSETGNENKNSPVGFFLSLLTAIYKASTPRGRKKAGAAAAACLFLCKAKDYLPPKTGSESYNNPSVFLQSTAKQLATEYRRHFKNGAFDLSKKIQQQKKKGLLPQSAPDLVDPNKTPTENFIILNRTAGRCWKLSPMSPLGSQFVLLSEDDLVKVFWRDTTLKEQLRSYARPTITSTQDPSQDDVVGWLKNLDPGILINKLLTDIGGFTEQERKKKKHWSRSAKRMSMDEIAAHISTVRNADFNPKLSYSENGYILRGSIKTDGFRLQLLAFKLNELNCIKYRRLDADKMPDPLTSTLRGTDHFLTEIRNVVKTKEDVERLWGCDPHNIKVLGIDLGKAFVVGASALLPSSMSATPTDGEEQGAITKIDIPLSTQFHNLAVSQKAVYQPTFKHRRWLEQRKGHASENEESITHIESNLPPLRGPEASVTKYVKESKVVESDLEAFYNNTTLKRHQWDAKRARDKEFKLVAKRLLELVGGTPGAKRDDKNKVIIGIGLGEFSSTSRLSSLHTAFSKYFMQLARSLGYIVVGVNEYYTSKRCPVCHKFVGQVDIRQLYCPTPVCGAKMHRDVMAGHNMCNVIQGHLLHQQRPHYLQPYDKDGNYIWEMEENCPSIESSMASLDRKGMEQPDLERMALGEKIGPSQRKRVAA
ncbi:hypothetical protein BGZ52_003017 [Haplosporangium bisporale]|nr:hypothetical protein BGZ52_003017 [Haplosporangium bisporale]